MSASSASKTAGSSSYSTSNEIQGFGGSLVVYRRDCGDRIADKADFVQCDRGLVLDDETEIGIDMIADQIIASEYGSYSGKSFGPRSIHFYDSRVRMRTTEDAAVQHARQLEIQSIVDATGNPLLRVNHADRLSYRHAISSL